MPSPLAVADHDRPLGLADLPPELWQELAQEPVAGPAPVAAAHPSIPVELNLARALEACERDTVEQALVEAGGSQSRAADLWASPAAASTTRSASTACGRSPPERAFRFSGRGGTFVPLAVVGDGGCSREGAGRAVARGLLYVRA
jgi:hypothetical protein